MRLSYLVPPALLMILACAGKNKDEGDGTADLSEGRTAGDCDDGADNDGDGLFDCDDPGCDGSPDCGTPTGDTADDTADDTAQDGPWPADACADDIHAGGDVTADFVLPDQLGGTLRLYDLCDHVVLLSFGAAWDGATQAHARDLYDLYDHYGPAGLVPVQILIEDARGDVPSGADLSAWADAYRLTFPVVSDPSDEVTGRFQPERVAVPYDVLIGRGAVVLDADGVVSDQAIDDAL